MTACPKCGGRVVVAGEGGRCETCGRMFAVQKRPKVTPSASISPGPPLATLSPVEPEVARELPPIPARAVSGVSPPRFLIESLGCPNCGAPYEPTTRRCQFCGSVLIITSLSETFARDLDTHQLAESVAKWRQRLKEDPECADAHFALGLSYLNLKLRDAALVHLRKAALLAPEVADTHYNLALTLFNDGNCLIYSPEHEEAMKEIDYSIRLAPDFREAVAFKHHFLGVKLLSVDKKLALVEYSKAVEACSSIATLHNNLGSCYSASGDYAQARACYQRAIDLDPNSAGSYSNLCFLLYEQMEYTKGIEAGVKAISLLGPATLGLSQATAHNNLALCLWKSGRKAEASEHIKKAMALNPGNPLYQQNLQAMTTECFVVTSTMGDYSHPWVIEMSAFRDHVLNKSAPGRWMIRCYRRRGPVLARVVASSLLLRRVSFVVIVAPAMLIVRLTSLILS